MTLPVSQGNDTAFSESSQKGEEEQLNNVEEEKNMIKNIFYLECEHVVYNLDHEIHIFYIEIKMNVS